METVSSTTPTLYFDSLTDVQISIDKRVSVDINHKTTLSEHLNTETNASTTPTSVVDSSTAIQMSGDKRTPSNSNATSTSQKIISFDYLLKEIRYFKGLLLSQ